MRVEVSDGGCRLGPVSVLVESDDVVYLEAMVLGGSEPDATYDGEDEGPDGDSGPAVARFSVPGGVTAVTVHDPFGGRPYKVMASGGDRSVRMAVIRVPGARDEATNAVGA